MVAEPAFPDNLKSRITRIIGFTKLAQRYKTFESRRQLLSEHDIFLADDRIITRLPKALGKVFYKGTTKRPIPVKIASSEKEKKENKKKKSKDEASAPPCSPSVLAQEIEKAIDAVPVSLRPGTLVAVRVGLVAFKPEELADNIVVVVRNLIEKHVVKGWRNVKGIHIKSQSSFAVPIWLADDLWMETNDIATVQAGNEVEDQGDKVAKDLKRKRNPATSKGPQAGIRKRIKVDEGKNKDSAGDRETTKARKTKLAAQKARVFEVEV